MGYVKVVKHSAYFSRFQVKYRRRREGKTDYRARLRLVKQDKNKYNTHKYRLVVRFSNKDVTCQIVYATIAGDVVVASAYSHELPDYGLKVGLTNWSAAYCTGLLVARRVLSKFNLAETYQGIPEEDIGNDYAVDPVEDGPKPFFCLLDAGLKATSTGSKIFGALKGALDGGLDIPYSEKRFVGYEKGKKAVDTETLRKYIYGGHVAEYMETMEEEEPEKYAAHFAKFVDAGISFDDIEDMYKEVHSAIRENPVKPKKDRAPPKEKTNWHAKKLTYDERKDALKKKLAELLEDE